MNDGSATDRLGSSRGTFTYQVCEAGTTTCSNTASVGDVLAGFVLASGGDIDP